MDPRQTKRKADDQPPQHTEGDPGEGTSAGPEPGPSPPKMPRHEDHGTERAVQYLEKLLAEETRGILSLGDPLFGYADVPGDEPFKTLEEIINEEPDDPLGKVQTIVYQTKLRIARNHTDLKNQHLQQMNDIRMGMEGKFKQLQDGVNNSIDLLGKVMEPFLDGKGILQTLEDTCPNYQLPPVLQGKYLECVKKLADETVKMTKMFETALSEKVQIKQKDLQDRITYTHLKYSVMTLNCVTTPKISNGIQQALIFLRSLPHHDDPDTMINYGLNMIKVLDGEQTDLQIENAKFDTLLINTMNAFYKEGNSKNDEIMLSMYVPIQQMSIIMNSLSAFICDETAHIMFSKSHLSTEDIVKLMTPKIQYLVREMYLKMCIEKTDKIKTWSLAELREIVNDNEREASYAPVTGGVLPENVPSPDIHLESVVLFSDTEEEESEAEEETETAEEEAEEQETQIEQGTQAEEGQVEAETEGESEMVIPETEQGETQAETEGEKAEESDDDTEIEEGLVGTILRAGKIKKEGDDGEGSKSLHPMMTRSKTDKPE
ncbi:regulatory protein IE1 [Cercopithecine betaherpesvirus 5]|uniref:Regulatory protein IE1 n=1 Tax=Simian cytomegalovirus (strain Colburn) TaxID=50292 RepID=G8XTH7_SCMVC|nr:regulatory protein IE1 [Cercopithecine betaherpesvirus 5]AEV80469.1 regulatory protein IE1 [Cercopithecine betaherpesvirus 5]